MVSTNNNLTEREISRFWQSLSSSREALATEDGQPLEIISPGWPNDDHGPDYKEAVILLGRVMIKGDIEIHVRSRSWKEHGHHLDAGYNRVVLHVVHQHDTGTDVRLQNGMAVPTLVLRGSTAPVSYRTLTPGLNADAGLPCRRNAGYTGLEEFLDTSGEARFRIKAKRFRKDLDRLEAGQCLYQGIMEALGYSRNKTPFLELAKRLPLDVLQRAVLNCPEPDLLYRWQTLFFEISGLITAESETPLPLWWEDRYLKEQTLFFETLGTVPFRPESPVPISPDDWHLVKVRPNNSPLTRLTAMSHLLLRYRRQGLCEGLISLVREASPGPDVFKKLEETLIVRAPGYPSGLTLLGRQRAIEIIINVLLPFSFAWGEINTDTGLTEKAINLFQRYPRSGMNSVERYMIRRLGMKSSLINSALRQQGLIHVYKTLCAQAKCESCELGQFESG